MLKKNICDGVGVQDESIGTPLYPALFWLDNIFKKQGRKITDRTIRISHRQQCSWMFHLFRAKKSSVCMPRSRKKCLPLSFRIFLYELCFRYNNFLCIKQFSSIWCFWSHYCRRWRWDINRRGRNRSLAKIIKDNCWEKPKKIQPYWLIIVLFLWTHIYDEE